MPLPLHIDFETFSEADIVKVGAYRYASDPSTEILCVALAIGNEEPIVVKFDGVSVVPQKYEEALKNPEVLVYAHNAQFELAIIKALFPPDWRPDISRFRCSMSLARRAALPASLEKLWDALQLINQKDKRGKSLISKFCIPQKQKEQTEGILLLSPAVRIYPSDEPEAFAQLLDYCRQDVAVEQEVCRRLAYFDEPKGNRNYTLHEIINARGVTVNISGLENAQRIIEEETQIVSDRFKEVTGFDVTQNARLLEWVNEGGRSGGHKFDNLQAETVDSFLSPFEEEQENVSEVITALRMRQSIAYASIKKVRTMIACAGPMDNRVRGMLNHHGAATGRSTNSLVQFQNMKRPTIKNSEEAYRDICDGVSREMLEMSYGPPLEVISSCVRHFVHDLHPETGASKPLWDADFASVEARIVCWLAGEEDALTEYRNGVDRYKVMAGLIYNIPAESVNKHPQRFIGKTAILGCGFGMGSKKFRDTCAKQGGYKLPSGLEDFAINAFRSKHQKIVKYWRDVESAAKKAVARKGELVKLRNIGFLHKDIEGMPFLLIKLPSGRLLAYPRPALAGGSITFFGGIAGKAIWGRVGTYGGKLVENITQAVASDFMTGGAANAEAAGYEIAALVHDQALAYTAPGQSAEEFCRLLTTLPNWAEGMPLEAEGGAVPFYRKD